MRKLHDPCDSEIRQKRAPFSKLAIAGAVLLSACAGTAPLPTAPAPVVRTVAPAASRGPTTFDDPSVRVLKIDGGAEFRILYPPDPLERMITSSERYGAKTMESEGDKAYVRSVSQYFMENGQLVIRSLNVGLIVDKATGSLCSMGVGFNKELGKKETRDTKGFEFDCITGPNGQKIYSAKIIVTVNPRSMTAFAVPYDKDGGVIGSLSNGDMLAFGLTFMVSEQKAVGGWAILRYSHGEISLEPYFPVKVSSASRLPLAGRNELAMPVMAEDK